LLFSIEGYGKLLGFYDGLIIFCFNFVDIGAPGFVWLVICYSLPW